MSEDAGEADKDNAEDSCVFAYILAKIITLTFHGQSTGRAHDGHQRPHRITLRINDHISNSGSQLFEFFPDVRVCTVNFSIQGLP